MSFGSAMRVFLLANYLIAFALALYTPVAPRQGSYEWEIIISDKSGPVGYTGGRTLYDFVSGYVRMESWNTPDPNPGINGITLWDLREQQPVVWTIDENTNCFFLKLSTNVTAPTPFDFTGYRMQNVSYFNRALAEKWTEPFGGVVYVDVFSRNVVGVGNMSTTVDGQTIFYNIQSWTDKKPDGTEFLLPNTVPCQPINAVEGFDSAWAPLDPLVTKRDAQFSIQCEGCKLAIGLIIGRLCNGVGALACAPFPPSIPFCAVLAGIACKFGVGHLTKEKACQIIRLC